MMTALCFAIFITAVGAQEQQPQAVQSVGEVSTDDPEMIELRKEQLRMAVEAEKARMEMEQAEALRTQQLTRYFGYSYFLGAGAQTVVSENLPVPANYVLGPGDQIDITFWGTTRFAKQPVPDNYILAPGDQLMVSLWGQAQMQNTYILDGSGRIFVPEIGPLLVAGKPIHEAEEYLKSEFSRVYATLNSTKDRTYMDVTLGTPTSMSSGTYTIDRDGRIFVTDLDEWLFLSGKTLEECKVLLKSRYEQFSPTLKGPKATTFMDVSLGTLKSINVQSVGEVTTPGIYILHPFSSIGNGITAAGGITMTGSLRDVKVLRKGEAVNSVDYYKLFLEGQSEKDFRLLDQDVIFVPIRKSTVEISGEVHRPGVYEMLPGESIEQLISFAGGLKPTAGSSVELRRISKRETRESDDDPLSVDYLNIDDLNPHEVMDGDDIWVKSIMEVSRQVYVSGQVKRPGAYAYADSLRLLDLLEMAGGIYDEDYLKSVNLQKLDITRRDINSDYSEVLTLRLAEVINDNGQHNILLHNHDQVTIYPNLKYFPAKTVTISGEVLLPGVYPIQEDFETLGSIINRAGGYTSRAFEEGIVVTREGVRLVIEGLENTVADGDIITVPEKTDVVEVTGAVYNPGYISFKKGRSLNQYVRMAGGLTPEANKNDIIVVYADGSVKLKRYYISPGLRPGATIQVNSRPVATPTEALLGFLTEISNTLAQIVASYVLITQIGGILK